MSERKFAKGLAKPGTAAQLRETVSQVVRESTVQVSRKIYTPQLQMLVNGHAFYLRTFKTDASHLTAITIILLLLFTLHNYFYSL